MIKLYNRDCMDALKEFKDNQFDLAIVDPPRSGAKLQYMKLAEARIPKIISISIFISTTIISI